MGKKRIKLRKLTVNVKEMLTRGKVQVQRHKVTCIARFRLLYGGNMYSAQGR